MRSITNHAREIRMYSLSFRDETADMETTETERLLAEAAAIVRRQIGCAPPELVGQVFGRLCREHDMADMEDDEIGAPPAAEPGPQVH